jgi:hypothetical protein
MAWKKLSSGKKVGSGIIYSGACFYFGFACRTGKTSFTVTLYDETSATGNEVEDYQTDANREMDGHVHSSPVVCRKGLYLELGGGSVIVYYTPMTEGVQ